MRELLDELKQADESNLLGYTRHLCERVLAIDPDHGRTLVRYACCLTAMGLYDEAGNALDRAERVVPSHRLHFVYVQRGHLCELSGDFAQAERFHLMAHELDPDDATYLVFAASVAFRRGDAVRAEELSRRAIECKEGCLDEVYSNLGGYLLVQRRYREARECYRKALAIDPEYVIVKTKLDDVERILGDG